jgi:hypothetical protein
MTASRGPLPAGRLAAVLAMFALIVLATAADGGAVTPSRAASVDDRLTVYCLAEGRRAQLIEAAALIQVIRPDSSPDRVVLNDGTAIEIKAWLQRADGGFSRSCRALFEAQHPGAAATSTTGSSGGRQTVAVLVTAVVSALLGYAFAEWRTVRERRLAAADRLRDAALRLRRSVRAYAQHAAAVTGRPDPAECMEHRDDLRREVVRYLGAGRTYAQAARLLAELDEVTVLASFWPPDAFSRREAMGRLVAWSRRIEYSIEILACDVEQMPRPRATTQGEVSAL